jgi:hypothetical protein
VQAGGEGMTGDGLICYFKNREGKLLS